MKKKYFFLFLLIIQLGVNAQKNVRERIDFNKDWFFSLTESAISEMPSSTNVNWRKLNLPHDWSIEGKFDEHSPATTGGAALNGGLGWYCKSFSLPVSEKGKQISIDFDGVYRNSEVFINGHSLGIRPNGFISFRYNLTPFLKFGSEKNIIAVKVDNSQQPNSRWYSGSGIYRNVWLVKTAAIAVDQWGTFLTTPTITKDQASVNLSIKIASKYPSAKKIAVFTYVLDAAGTIVASNITANTSIKSELILSQALVVKKPILWNLEKPYLYQAITTIKLDGQVVDAYETSFGIILKHRIELLLFPEFRKFTPITIDYISIFTTHYTLNIVFMARSKNNIIVLIKNLQHFISHMFIAWLCHVLRKQFKNTHESDKTKRGSINQEP